MMSKLSFRSSYWDNIKGFLIFLVVFAHCLYDFQDDALIGAIEKAFICFICLHSFLFPDFSVKARGHAAAKAY